MAEPTTFTIDDHFKNQSPTLHALYDEIVAEARKFGPVIQEAKKTSIHLVNRTAFAGVRVRKDYLLLNLKSDHKIKSKRIVKSEQLSARRFHHEIKIASAKDLGAELRGWLREAYALSA